MSILAREPESKFTPAPEGLFQAVCVDVVDLGLVKSQYGEKHKVEIRWQLDLICKETERRYDVRRWFTLSLHEKASLRQTLETWRGRKFTPEELKGFDLERLIGVNCQVQVIHNLSDEGRTYANVQAVVPAPAKVPKIAPLDYVREQDRPKQQGNGAPEFAGDDDPVPF